MTWTTAIALSTAGYRCILCPDATLYHDEGKSRGFDDNPRELAAFRQRYRGRVDPWYNPNLSLENEQFEILTLQTSVARQGTGSAIAVSHNLNHEGAPNSQFEMITGLQLRGVIDPVVLSPCDGPLHARYKAAGIPVQMVSPLLTGKAQFDETIKVLARIFCTSGAEVVYANTRANVLGDRRSRTGPNSGALERARKRAMAILLRLSAIGLALRRSRKLPLSVSCHFRRLRNPTGLGALEQPPQLYDHLQRARFGTTATRCRRSFAGTRAIGIGDHGNGTGGRVGRHRLRA